MHLLRASHKRRRATSTYERSSCLLSRLIVRNVGVTLGKPPSDCDTFSIQSESDLARVEGRLVEEES